MSKCPFWSTANEKVHCYSECPMNPVISLEEVCPFQECATVNKINFKDIVDENFAYSQDNVFEFEGISDL